LPSTTLSSRNKGTSGQQRFVIAGLCSIILNEHQAVVDVQKVFGAIRGPGATSALLATGITRGMAQLLDLLEGDGRTRARSLGR
jgi:hypothetical protein